jgi:hypothetical protein
MTAGSSTRSSRGEQAKPELYGQKKEAKTENERNKKKNTPTFYCTIQDTAVVMGPGSFIPQATEVCNFLPYV